MSAGHDGGGGACAQQEGSQGTSQVPPPDHLLGSPGADTDTHYNANKIIIFILTIVLLPM
jgi:hypothetical protein